MSGPLRVWMRWTTTEIETLETMLAAGETYETIGDVLHRPPDSIRGACRRLRLKRPKHIKVYRPLIEPRTQADAPGCFKPLWESCFKKTPRQHWLAVRSAITRTERQDVWQRIPPDVYGAVLQQFNALLRKKA